MLAFSIFRCLFKRVESLIKWEVYPSQQEKKKHALTGSFFFSLSSAFQNLCQELEAKFYEGTFNWEGERMNKTDVRETERIPVPNGVINNMEKEHLKTV